MLGEMTFCCVIVSAHICLYTQGYKRVLPIGEHEGDKNSKHTWAQETTHPSIASCHNLATKMMYTMLDLKDWYLKNSHSSGGSSRQCVEDEDDDWIKTGDPGR